MCSPSSLTISGLTRTWISSFSVSITATWSGTPICGAASPTPGASRIVSIMSCTRVRIDSSKRDTLRAFLRRTAFPSATIGRTVIPLAPSGSRANCISRAVVTPSPWRNIEAVDVLVDRFDGGQQPGVVGAGHQRRDHRRRSGPDPLLDQEVLVASQRHVPGLREIEVAGKYRHVGDQADESGQVGGRIVGDPAGRGDPKPAEIERLTALAGQRHH